MTMNKTTKPPPSSLPPRRHHISRSAPSSPQHSPSKIRRHFHHRSSQVSSSNYSYYPTRSSSKLIFESPRLEHDDHHLFPGVDMDLKTHDTRWKYMQNVAGEHQQEVSCLNLSRHANLTPLALRMGTPAAVAKRVTELHLNVLKSVATAPPEEDDSVAELPIWLDAISETFPALRHLTLQQHHKQQLKAEEFSISSTDDVIELHSDSSASHQIASNDKYATESDEAPTPVSDKGLSDVAMVRRLYILYRLPKLEMLDGIPVNVTERRLAHPRDRAQERQQQEKTSSCLLDVEEDEENQSRTSRQSPTAKRGKPALAETPVEVDVNGKPLTRSPRSKAALQNNNSCSLCPVLYDLDRIEYESVESTQVCEWGAACGALSLPYFRNKTRILDREKAKTRFHMKLCRPPPVSTAHAATLHTHTLKESLDGAVETPQLSNLPRKSSISRLTDPVMHVEDMNDHGEMIFEARPQRQRSGLALPSSPRGQALASTLRSLDRTLSSSSQSSSPRRHPPPSRSLTSPFPMQFRVRVVDTTARNLTVSTDLAILEEDTPPQAPRDSDCALQETIEYTTISLARAHSSPTKLPSTCLSGGSTGDLPPRFPESKRVTNAGSTTASSIELMRSRSTTKASRSKRRGSRWRVKLKARSASIMDDDDDEEDAEDEYAESDSSEDDVLVLTEGPSI